MRELLNRCLVDRLNVALKQAKVFRRSLGGTWLQSLTFESDEAAAFIEGLDLVFFVEVSLRRQARELDAELSLQIHHLKLFR